MSRKALENLETIDERRATELGLLEAWRDWHATGGKAARRARWACDVAAARKRRALKAQQQAEKMELARKHLRERLALDKE